MEVPITKPSKISYADDINFAELLKDLMKSKHNGFIRVTNGTEEGFLLLKDGKQVAASYDRNAKSEAVESIKSAIKEPNTLIEVFDLRRSYIDYLIDINKPYLFESSYNIYDIIEELKKSRESETQIKEEEKPDQTTTVKEPPITTPVSETKQKKEKS